MSRIPLFLLGLIATVALVSVLDRPLGDGPALGRLLHPFDGVWTNAGPARPASGEDQLALPGLEAPVLVRYDADGVPHLFAENLKDLVMAQGYVVAADRLWQMEFQTHAAAGRLSEILGPDFAEPGDGKILRFDRLQRREGLGYAGEQGLKGMQSNPDTWALVEAYARGVNAYIESLEPADYPLEYKLLGYAPEPWTPLKTSLLTKLMAQDLSSREYDLEHTRLLAHFGAADFAELFPDQANMRAPIVAPGTPFDFGPIDLDTPETYVGGLPSPEAMEVLEALKTDGLLGEELASWRSTKAPEGYGSNNWAVSGEHTASGYPMLANDPHLALKLPSIWYQVQLQAGGYNVRGVTLPGAPGVVIGFNEHAAWGVTNSGRDVRDWYRIQFVDARQREYRHDGSIKPVTERVEEIRIKGGETLYDTVRYTHHGPVVYDARFGPAAGEEDRLGLALRWEMHQVSNEMATFLGFNTARNLDDYRKALEAFQCPGQNFLFASGEGDIAITQQGRFPARWPGQGRFLLDGSRADHDWQAYIPREQNAQNINPPRGFVGSANQYPADSTYPYYQLGEFEDFRNRRYVERLYKLLAEKPEGLTPQDMMDLQLDNMAVYARDLLPALLEAVPEAREQLGSWDAMYHAESREAARFNAWYDTLYHMAWDECSALGEGYRKPERHRLIALALEEPDSRWWDLQRTPETEDFSALAQMAWAATSDEDRLWWEARGSTVSHLLNLPALSRMEVPAGGGKSILNATTSEWAASWRMVVELSSPPKAWGIYPGGQSGHPGDPNYDALLDDWIAGRYRELLFLMDREDRPESTPFTLTLEP
jgi:penicillin amidase